MDRRRLLATGAAGVLAASLSAASTEAAPMRPPNYFAVLCDDQGYGDVSI